MNRETIETQHLSRYIWCMISQAVPQVERDGVSYFAWSSVVCVVLASLMISIRFPVFSVVAIFIVAGFVLSILTIVRARKLRIGKYFVLGLGALIFSLPLVGHLILFAFVLSQVSFVA